MQLIQTRRSNEPQLKSITISFDHIQKNPNLSLITSNSDVITKKKKKKKTNNRTHLGSTD